MGSCVLHCKAGFSFKQVAGKQSADDPCFTPEYDQRSGYMPRFHGSQVQCCLVELEQWHVSARSTNTTGQTYILDLPLTPFIAPSPVNRLYP